MCRAQQFMMAANSQVNLTTNGVAARAFSWRRKADVSLVEA